MVSARARALTITVEMPERLRREVADAGMTNVTTVEDPNTGSRSVKDRPSS